MAIIGTFSKDGEGYKGELTTLRLQAKNVAILPNERATGDQAPSHRVFFGKAEVGAGWTTTSRAGTGYLNLKLDDPTFPAPIHAALFEDTDTGKFNLVWDRPKSN